MQGLKFKLYDDVKAFHAAVYDVLLENEIQNQIMVGNLMRGYEGRDTFDWRDPRKWMMGAVCKGDATALVAMMTPPFNITLYATGNNWDNDTISCLINGLEAAGISIPGVTTEKSLAEAFAQAYCSAKTLRPVLNMGQTIFELKDINPNIPKIGTFRPATEKDIPFLPYWLEDFGRTATGEYAPPSTDVINYMYRINSGGLYVLEDKGMPVSIAAIIRKMVRVATVGCVYTPPYFRGRGYASSLVSRISQIILDSGYPLCSLYTDLTNPTSNKIYRNIGYMPVLESVAIDFEE